jgi:hypothetical protein
MAAPITTVGGTLEQQAMEVIEALADQQRDEATNPNGIEVVTTNTYNDNTGIANYSLAIPFTTGRSGTTGAIEATAVEVFGVL